MELQKIAQELIDELSRYATEHSLRREGVILLYKKLREAEANEAEKAQESEASTKE